MPQTVNQHQTAVDGVELRGFGYSKVANVAALPASGQAGEIVTVTATGVDHQWNAVLGVWVPWNGGGSVAPHVAALTGDGTTTDFTVTHNLNTLAPEVTVVDNDALNSGANRQVLVTPIASAVTLNSFHLVFFFAPTAGETFTVVTRTGISGSGGGGGGAATNLSTVATATTVTIESDSGLDATIAAATPVAAGVMSAADKVKVNAVTGTNTGDQTAATVPVTPTGNLGSANVQSALVEIQTQLDGVAGGGGSTSTHSVDGQGRLVLNNGAGTTVQVAVDLEQKTVFASQNFTTLVSDSAVEVFRTAWQIEAYQIIVQTAPTGTETYSLQDVTGNSTIFSASITSGQTTTGLVVLPTPVTIPAGNRFRARILTVNGSEGFVMHVWRTPVLRGFEVA
jgi:hypothetical protein